MINLLIVWCLNTFSTEFQLNPGGKNTYPWFPEVLPEVPEVLLTSTPHNILSKPLAAFPHNHSRNNGQQRERNESCCNDYHQSSEGILVSNQQPPVVKSTILPTELRGTALLE